MVSGTMLDGEIGPVTIESTHDGPCRVRNPWPEETVLLEADGLPRSIEQEGDLLTFHTSKSERLVLERDA